MYHTTTRDKYKHKWFAEKILQKATGFKAQRVKDMLNNSGIEWVVKLEIKIKNGRIVSFEALDIEDSLGY